MIVPYTHVMMLSGILFLCGMACAMLRRNLIMMLIGLEIMLNAVAVAFVGAGLLWQQTEGQVMALFILTVAAAEVSVGLALVVYIYRKAATLSPECVEPDEC